MQAMIRPSMLPAVPISSALVMPSRSVKSGTHARVVPMPPTSEMEPTSRPARGSRPKVLATPMPSMFCRMMKVADSASSTTNGRPPATRVLTSDFNPMPAKKYSSSRSRTFRSKWMRMLATKYTSPTTSVHRKPPTTGSGMLYLRSVGMRWVSSLPTNSRRIASVNVTKASTSTVVGSMGFIGQGEWAATSYRPSMSG